jgi:hypothetical protein
LGVTSDGEYILATSKTYILLIPTKVPDDDKERLGFEGRGMGKKKPKPIKLTIRQADKMKFDIRDVNFNSARFNTGMGSEAWIVASTGRFIITWNFTKLKEEGSRARFAYTLRETDDVVIDNQFRFDKDAVVVGAKDDIYCEERRNI